MFDKLGGTQIVRDEGHFGDVDDPHPTFELLDKLSTRRITGPLCNVDIRRSQSSKSSTGIERLWSPGLARQALTSSSYVAKEDDRGWSLICGAKDRQWSFEGRAVCRVTSLLVMLERAGRCARAPSLT
jgi:hypothetical protein